MAQHAADSQAGAQGRQQAEEYQMLHESFMQYAECVKSPASELSKVTLNHLTEQLQAKGVYGHNALQLLHKHSAQIAWQSMAPDMFSTFYRFVYFLCREPGKRSVQAKTAVAAWRALLRGRFRLLDRWTAYVTGHHRSPVVLEDTWRQVLDFARSVHEDLGNYDAASAWPVLLDEFVEHLRGASMGRRSAEPSDTSGPWGVDDRALTAVSPRSGSKRRLPDILEVVDQLQQLPLGSNGQQQLLPHSMPQQAAASGLPAHQRTPAPAFAASHGGLAGGPCSTGAPKRYRAQAHSSAGGARSNGSSSGGGGGGSGSGGGSECAGCGDAMMVSLAPGASPGGRAAAGSKAPGFSRSPWSPQGHHRQQHQQQQQQQQLGASDGAFGGVFGSSGGGGDGCGPMPPLLRVARVACGGAAGDGFLQQQQQQQVQEPGHAGAPGLAVCGPFGPLGFNMPSGCPSLGGGVPLPHAGGVLGAPGFGGPRHSNVNAMVQVTVTEALGFN